MADTKTSALPAVTTVAGATEIPVNEAGTSKKLTVDQIKVYTVNSEIGLSIALSNGNYLN